MRLLRASMLSYRERELLYDLANANQCSFSVFCGPSDHLFTVDIPGHFSKGTASKQYNGGTVEISG